MQWQGDLADDLPLLGMYHSTAGKLAFATEASVRRMTRYPGSVALSPDGARVAVTSPRSGAVQVFEQATLSSEAQLAEFAMWRRWVAGSLSRPAQDGPLCRLVNAWPIRSRGTIT